MSHYNFPQAESCVLGNGFKYIYYAQGENPVVCLQAHVRSGSTHEDIHHSGYAHFIEHTSFKATRSFPKNDLSDYVQSLGGTINAYTDFDSTCYYLMLPSEKVADGVRILSELIRHAKFSPEDIRVEKDIILDEIRQYENEPETDFIEYIQSSYFVQNPMRHPILGYPQSIRSATAGKLRAYYRKTYTPVNSFLVVCGQYDLKDLHSAVILEFGDWETASIKNDPNLDQFLDPEQTRYRFDIRKASPDSEMIAFVVPELTERNFDSEHYLFAMRYFAIGKSSLLYKKLVEEEHLCSSVRVISLSGVLSGASLVMITPFPKVDCNRILDVIVEEYHRTLIFDADPAEFDLIRRDIFHGWYYSFETMENLASALATEELLGSYRSLYEYDQRISLISSESIPAILAKHWLPDNLAIFLQNNRKLPGLKQLPASAFDVAALPNTQKVAVANLSAKSHLATIPARTGYNSAIQPVYSELPYTLYELDNGFRIMHKRSHRSPVTGFSLTTDISQLMEDEEHRGHNYLTSTALLYGSKNFPYEDVMRYSRMHGFNIRVVHHTDTTSYKGKCFTNGLGHVVKLLSELLLYPTFPIRFIKTIKESSIDAIRRDNDFPAALGYNRWQNMIVGRESNLQRSSGTISQISAVTRKDILAWHQNSLDLSRYCLAVVGDYEPEEVFDIVAERFGVSLPGPGKKLSATPYFRSSKVRTRLDNEHGDQAVIHAGGFGVPSDNVLATTAFHVLAQILGGDMGSRFFNTLREKYGYAYQTGFDFSSISTQGMWCAFSYCGIDSYRKARSAMLDILRDVYEKGVTNSELELAKNYLISMNRFDLESVSWLASTLANLVALGYPPEHFIEREPRLRGINLDQVNSLCHDYLNPETIFTHTLI